MTGLDFISLAAKWAVLDAGEPTWRTSVSRAYYGAFHCAQEFLWQIGVPPPISKENTHLFVQQALMASENRNLKRAGSLLGSLHEARKLADYELGNSEYGSQTVAREKVGNAMTIKTLLEQCGDPVARSEIRDEIIAWKKRVRNIEHSQGRPIA